MIKYFFIALGGAAGALTRFFVVFLSARLFPGTFPLGTLIVNITGSFLATFLMQIFLHSAIDPLYRYFLVIGFLGALTTFSSFTFETLSLWQQHFYFLGFLNIFLNFFLSFLAGFLVLIVANFLFFK
jgi:CrcB protein